MFDACISPGRSNLAPTHPRGILENKLKLFLKGLAVASGIFALSAAHAGNYDNLSTPAGNIYYFGAPDTTNYGQVFNAPEAYLQGFQFYAISGYQGDFTFTVAKWDGTKAVGTALYSQELHYIGGAQLMAVDQMNLNLTVGGSYVAYVTVANESSPLHQTTFAGSSSGGSIGQHFVFLNSSMQDPLANPTDWDTQEGKSLAFSSRFSQTALVPEPETYAMLLAGLGLLGWTAKRRKSQA
jgi:hypothetical protein